MSSSACTKRNAALIEANCAIVCEGQLDLITLFEAGITNVVAPQGTAFTEEQARILKRFVSEVVLCFDADAAGQKAAERSLDALLQNDLDRSRRRNAGGRRSRFVSPKRRARRNSKSASRRRSDFFDYWIEREARQHDLNSLGAKMQLARKLAETVARVHDPLMRGEVAKQGERAARSASVRISKHCFPKPARERCRERSHRRARRLLRRVTRSRCFACSPCAMRRRASFSRRRIGAKCWRKLRMRRLLARILESDCAQTIRLRSMPSCRPRPPEEEALVSSWLLQKNAAERPDGGARTGGTGLRQASLRRQLQIAEGRMKLPAADAGRSGCIYRNKFLTCRSNSDEFPQFSPARVLDTLTVAEGAAKPSRASGIAASFPQQHKLWPSNRKERSAKQFAKAAAEV